MFKTFVIDDIPNFADLKVKFSEFTELDFDNSDNERNQLISALKTYYEDSDVNEIIDSKDLLNKFFENHKANNIGLYIIDLQLKEQTTDTIDERFNGIEVYKTFIKNNNSAAKVIFITGVNNNDVQNIFRTLISNLGSEKQFGFITRHINKEGIWWKSEPIINQFKTILKEFKIKKIFISYASDQNVYVNHLIDNSTNHFVNKYELLKDNHILENGIDWKNQLKRQLENCDLGLIILSMDYLRKLSSTSSFINKEFEEIKKKLFIIAFEEITNETFKNYSIYGDHNYKPKFNDLIMNHIDYTSVYYESIFDKKDNIIVVKTDNYVKQYFIKLTEEIDRKFN